MRQGSDTLEQVVKRLANLISVKSIVTVILTLVFAVLALRDRISAQEFITVFSVIVAFYFGTQSQKISDMLDKVGDDGQQ